MPKKPLELNDLVSCPRPISILNAEDEKTVRIIALEASLKLAINSLREIADVLERLAARD